MHELTTAAGFNSLRPWRGERSRAFEELSYQLLKARVPAGTRPIRTGNPDGGVEWYATLPDGTEWGWQAKFVDRIDALLTAMTGSVQRVAKDRPQLRKLTFVISWNLATGKNRKDDRKTQREKYDDKIKAWKRAIPRANEIEFDLIQESDLLAELAQPEHRGRRWFWWGSTTLGSDWLAQRHREQTDAASDKYRPDLQVDVPIQDDLLALGFDQSVRGQCIKRQRAVLSAIDDLHAPHASDDVTVALQQKVIDTAAGLKVSLIGLDVQSDTAASDFDPPIQQAAACLDAIYEIERHESQLAAAHRKLHKDDPAREIKPPEWASRYFVRELRQALDSFTGWLESSVGRAFRRRAYFLAGQAGSGKTHLFLDATKRALDADRPAVFLSGARFGQPTLWANIADQLGLAPIGSDELLQAMDAAGEAASLVGSRCVIFIDALNETTPPNFWTTHLPVLRTALAPYRHIALAVSCRDTYEDLVIGDKERENYVHCVHPGFADREVEATQRYFAHYHLEAPRIPLLTPEFTLPLFLRLYCESFQGSPQPPRPSGHEGRIAIFNRYLETKTATVARRFRPDAISSYEMQAAQRQVTAVLDGILDAMAQAGRESLSTTTAEDLTRAALPDTPTEAARVLGLLQEEGVLTREPLYLGDGQYEEGVRIVFQAFADFLLLKRRLARLTDPINDAAVMSWLRDGCSWGIREAATVYIPEVYGVELPDLLGEVIVMDRRRGDDPDEWRRQNRVRFLYEKLVQTLPYRESSAITERTIDLLNAAQPLMHRSEFYRVLFTIAPQPGNRLNADGLHRYLLQRRMPERDADFGFAVFHELSDPFGPVARLARWAADGPYPTYEADVIELACIPLCWLMSSPNRYMRDWVTKALVQLLRGHLDVMLRLLERFWSVDDPYVVQRVIAIAYGAVLRSTRRQATTAGALVARVAELVFTPPVRADELLLDAAQGIVRWGVAHGHVPEAALVKAKRPYGLTLPGSPPSEATLEAKYGWVKDQPDDESYSSIWLSIFSMGDFGRYIVESTFGHFSRYRHGQKYPKRQPHEPRFVKARWSKFVSSLTEEQHLKIAKFLANPSEGPLNRLSYLHPGSKDLLTEEQWKLLDAVYVYPKRVDHEYPADRARRWIMQRTISLGWTPARFGSEDRSVGRGRMGRESHKAERWGKKYQWMAFYELLARVADNYQLECGWNDEDEPDEGLHQLTGRRDIDPSLPPVDYHAFNGDDVAGEVSAWERPPIKFKDWPPRPIDFAKYRRSAVAFMTDVESEPAPPEMMFLRDVAGQDWVTLQAYFPQTDPNASKGWRGLKQRTGLDTLLVQMGQSQAIIKALTRRGQNESYGLSNANGHIDCCYIGEIGRTGPVCWHRHDSLRQFSVGGSTFLVAHTIEQYTWEGNILDCSLPNAARLQLPSTFAQQTAGLAFDMHGPSWLDASGSLIFAYYEEPGDDSHALLVRASYLRDFLAEHDMELLSMIWLERMELKDHYGRNDPHLDWTVEVWLDKDLVIHQGRQHRDQRGTYDPLDEHQAIRPDASLGPGAFEAVHPPSQSAPHPGAPLPGELG